LPSPLEREQGFEYRGTADEVAGRVDRIDDPSGLPITRHVPELLTEHAVARERLLDTLAQHVFDAGVRLGDQRSVRLGGQRVAPPKGPERDPVGLVTELHGEGQEAV